MSLGGKGLRSTDYPKGNGGVLRADIWEMVKGLLENNMANVMGKSLSIVP
jgi:hypothetical protein